jgi:lipid A 3-O-deacylase
VRSSGVIVFAAGLAALCGQASATDLPPPPAVTVANTQVMFGESLYHPERFELRGGVFAHALSSPESGSADLNLELVAPKFFVIPGLPEYFTPRLHAGGMVNTAGKTSYGYAGALWTYNVTPRWFIEGFFGGLVHNGRLDDIADNMNGLGCRWGFHSGGSIGYRFNAHWSVMGTFDHLSNGGLCTNNKGLNNYGLRAAYSFGPL